MAENKKRRPASRPPDDVYESGIGLEIHVQLSTRTKMVYAFPANEKLFSFYPL